MKILQKGQVMRMKVTALMDNQASEHKGLVAEHGFSLLIERDGLRLLFDCGQGRRTLENARRLGIDLKALDTVVLSHSHYDHAAGYRDLTEAGLGSGTLITGEHFFEKKYAVSRGCYTDISCGFDETFLQEHNIVHRVCKDTYELGSGLWAIGNFPRIHDVETIPARFVRDTGKKHADGTPELSADDFADEICLAADTPDGLAVFVGCSHPGILNIVDHVHAVLEKPVAAVYGGTHLVEADEKRIRATVGRLKQLGLLHIGFSHCSGELAEKIAAEEEGVKSRHLASGSVLFLPDRV